MSYKFYNDIYGDVLVMYLHPNSNHKTYFPMVPGNRQYEEYRKWLAEGNETLPAD